MSVVWKKERAATGHIIYVAYLNGYPVGRVTKSFRTPRTAKSPSWAPSIPTYNGHLKLKDAKAEIVRSIK